MRQRGSGYIQAFFKRGDLIALFLIAIIVRLIFLAASNNQVGIYKVLEECFDCRLYLTAAHAFAMGNTIPENALFYYGPGYIYFLGSVIKIIGYHLYPIILVNISLSALGCLFIYGLARTVTESYPIAIIAGILACFSYTSVTLSCMTLSDTFYFTLTTLTLLVFTIGLKTGKWHLFVISGVLFGYSILTRSVGQFFPLSLLAIAIAYVVFSKSHKSKNRSWIWGIYKRMALTLLIIIGLLMSWMIRNYHVHGEPYLAISCGLGPANVAAVTIERLTGKFSQETLDEWNSDLPGDNPGYGDMYRNYRRKAGEVYDTLSREMIHTYFMILWENLNDINLQHRFLLPEYYNFTFPREYYIRDHYLNFLPFAMTIAGFIILIVRRYYWPAIFLITIYIYYALMIGAFRWQGARYSFPCNIAGNILAASAVHFVLAYICIVIALLRKKVSKISRSISG